MYQPNDCLPELSRRSFLANAALFLAAATGIEGLLTACGDSATAVEAQTRNGGNCDENGTSIAIEVTHTPNHTLTIPKEDVIAGAQKNYTLSDNGSGHTHEVTITAQDFINLRKNVGIIEVSTFNVRHAHEVVVNCL